MGRTLRSALYAAISRHHSSCTGRNYGAFPDQDRFVIAYVLPIPTALTGGSLSRMITTPAPTMPELGSCAGG
jgi:hypothetical protein